MIPPNVRSVPDLEGDTNDVIDRWEGQLAPQVLRVWGHLPVAGYVILASYLIFAAQTASGRVLLIGMPLVVLIGIQVLDSFRRPRMQVVGLQADAPIMASDGWAPDPAQSLRTGEGLEMEAPRPPRDQPKMGG